MHLAYDLLEEWRVLVLVDALPNHGAPGTLHVFEADHETLSPPLVSRRTAWIRLPCSPRSARWGTAPRTIVVGCEVENVDEGMGLSEPVAAAVRGRGGHQRRASGSAVRTATTVEG